MEYKIRDWTIESDDYREELRRGYLLQVLRRIVEGSGCTLKEAKDLVDQIIERERIRIEPAALAIQEGCLAELKEE